MQVILGVPVKRLWTAWVSCRSWTPGGVLCLILAAFLFQIPDPAPSQPQPDNPEKRQRDFALGLFQRKEYKEAAQEFAVYMDHQGWDHYRDVAAFFQGESYRHLGKPDQAAQAYQAALDAGATGEYAARSRYRLASISLEQGKPQKAVELLQTMEAEFLPEEFREGVLYSLAAARSRVGDPKGAIQDWSRFREEFPESPNLRRALLGQALEESRSGDWRNAADHLEAWRKDDSASKDPAYSSVISELALCRERLGEAPEAIKFYVALADISSASAVKDRALLAAGRLAFESGDTKTLDSLAPRARKEIQGNAARLSWFLLEGNRFYRDQSWKESVRSYTQALECARKEPPASASGGIPLPIQISLRLAWCSHSSRDWPGVVKHLAPVLEQPSPGDEACFLMGEATKNMGDWQESADWYAKVSPGVQLKEHSLVGEADTAFRTDQWERAAKAYQTVIPTSKPSVERVSYLVRAGDCERNLEHWAAAAILYASAALESASAEIRERAFYLEGWCRFRQEDYPGAVRALGQIAESFPESTHLDESLYLLGQSYGKTGQPEKQIEAYERLATEFPKTDWNADGLIQLAAVYSAQGNRAGILSALLRFQGLFPERKLERDYALWLSDALVQGSQWEKALSTLEPLLQEDLSSADRETCFYLAGLCQERLGRWQEATAEYRQVLDQFPDGTKLLASRLGVGRSQLRAGDLEAASKEVVTGLAQLQQAASSQPSLEAQFYLLQGDIEYSRGHYSEAYRAYARTSILYRHPEYTPRALYMSALCKERLGEPDVAAELKDQMKREYPDISEQEAAAWSQALESRKS